MAQMVLGELGPKNLAIAKPEACARALAHSTVWYMRLASPLIRLFDSASNGLLRALGIEPIQEPGGGVSAEELEHIIEHSGREGALTPKQTERLSRALEFRSLRATHAMVPRPQIIALPMSATCEDLRRVAADSGHSRFPIIGDGLDDVRGVVQARDVLAVPVAARTRMSVRTLAKTPFVVPESARLGPLLGDMRERHTSLAVIVDEYGGTAGIVTLEDIVEELVGSIQDEYDVMEAAPLRHADGSYLVPGAWRIDEAERDLGVELPAGDYDTLGGLIMERLGRVPVPGDRVELDSASLWVDRMEGRAVAQVRLLPRAPDNGRADAEDGS
jgi:CBS domain containing-hemolysin-like protein